MKPEDGFDAVDKTFCHQWHIPTSGSLMKCYFFECCKLISVELSGKNYWKSFCTVIFLNKNTSLRCLFFFISPVCAVSGDNRPRGSGGNEFLFFFPETRANTLLFVWSVSSNVTICPSDLRPARVVCPAVSQKLMSFSANSM